MEPSIYSSYGLLHPYPLRSINRLILTSITHFTFIIDSCTHISLTLWKSHWGFWHWVALHTTTSLWQVQSWQASAFHDVLFCNESKREKNKQIPSGMAPRTSKRSAVVWNWSSWSMSHQMPTTNLCVIFKTAGNVYMFNRKVHSIVDSGTP